MTHFDGGSEARSDSWESFLENRDYVAAANLLRPLVAEARASYLNMIEGLGLDVEQARRQLERVQKGLSRRLEELEEDFESWAGEHKRELKAAEARGHYVLLLGRLVECLFRLNEDDEALALGRDAIEAGDPPFVCYEHCAAILGRRGQVGETVELVATVAQEREGWRKGPLTERSLFRVGQYAAFTAGRLEESLKLARSGEAWCEERGFLEERSGFLEHQGRTLEKMRALDDAKEIYRRAIAGPVPSTTERRWMYPLESIFKRYMILLGKEKGQDDEIRRVANLVLAGGFSAAAEEDARKRLARLEETPRRRTAARAAVPPFSVRAGSTPELAAKKKRPHVDDSAIIPAGWVLGGSTSTGGVLAMVQPSTLGRFQMNWELITSTDIRGVRAPHDLIVAWGGRERSGGLLLVNSSGEIVGSWVPEGRISCVAIRSERIFVGLSTGSLVCLDREARSQWEHILSGNKSKPGDKRWGAHPVHVDCTNNGNRVVYWYYTDGDGLSSLASLRADSGSVEWMRKDQDWERDIRGTISDALTIVVTSPDYGSGMAFAESGSLFYNSQRGYFEFDGSGRLVSHHQVAEGQPVKDNSGTIRGLMKHDGFTSIDDQFAPTGHLPCEAGWKVRVHHKDRLLAILDGRNILVASFDAEILAKMEFAARVNMFEWWGDDLLVSAGSELLWLTWGGKLDR